MVYRNNAGRLGSGFISVCLETRWLGQNSGFYVPERLCMTIHGLASVLSAFLAVHVNKTKHNMK